MCHFSAPFAHQFNLDHAATVVQFPRLQLHFHASVPIGQHGADLLQFLPALDLLVFDDVATRLFAFGHRRRRVGGCCSAAGPGTSATGAAAAADAAACAKCAGGLGFFSLSLLHSHEIPVEQL